MSCTIFNLNLNLTLSSTTPRRLLTKIWNHDPRLIPTQANFTGNRWKRRCFSANVSSSELPLLPFDINQVLVPSENKTLHLYEERYLALLEESLFRKKKFFVHFVLDPIVVNDSSAGASFAATYGCLVFIENVERLDVGGLVSIRGIGRVKIVKLVQVDPYLKGVVVPMQDNVPDCASKISSKVLDVKESLYSLNSLEIKLKAPKEALLQTQIAKSLMWAEKDPFMDCYEAFVPSLAERVSFAALQPVSVEASITEQIVVVSPPAGTRARNHRSHSAIDNLCSSVDGSTQSELLRLQREKQKAMDVKDTLQRLDDSLKLVKRNISMVAAKLAIQSLDAQ